MNHNHIDDENDRTDLLDKKNNIGATRDEPTQDD